MAVAAAFFFEPLQIRRPKLLRPPRLLCTASSLYFCALRRASSALRLRCTSVLCVVLLLHCASVVLLVHCAAAVLGFDLRRHASIYSYST